MLSTKDKTRHREMRERCEKGTNFLKQVDQSSSCSLDTWRERMKEDYSGGEWNQREGYN